MIIEKVQGVAERETINGFRFGTMGMGILEFGKEVNHIVGGEEFYNFFSLFTKEKNEEGLRVLVEFAKLDPRISVYEKKPFGKSRKLVDTHDYN